MATTNKQNKKIPKKPVATSSSKASVAHVNKTNKITNKKEERRLSIEQPTRTQPRRVSTAIAEDNILTNRNFVSRACKKTDNFDYFKFLSLTTGATPTTRKASKKVTVTKVPKAPKAVQTKVPKKVTDRRMAPAQTETDEVDATGDDVEASAHEEDAPDNEDTAIDGEPVIATIKKRVVPPKKRRANATQQADIIAASPATQITGSKRRHSRVIVGDYDLEEDHEPAVVAIEVTPRHPHQQGSTTDAPSPFAAAALASRNAPSATVPVEQNRASLESPSDKEEK